MLSYLDFPPLKRVTNWCGLVENTTFPNTELSELQSHMQKLRTGCEGCKTPSKHCTIHCSIFSCSMLFLNVSRGEQSGCEVLQWHIFFCYNTKGHNTSILLYSIIFYSILFFSSVQVTLIFNAKKVTCNCYL